MKVKSYQDQSPTGMTECQKCREFCSKFFKLDGWEDNDFLCGDCFATELEESEAEYEVFNKHQLPKND